MSYTWGDIKLATLQKMFAADGSSIVTDESTKDYIAGMPYAANEGLVRLATAGKFITKPISLNHMVAKNFIPDQTATALNDGSNFTFKTGAVKSYYFQYSGIGTCTISRENLVTTIPIDSYGKFTEIRGNFDNDTNEEVTITFQSNYPATVKDIALYDTYFPEVDGKALVPEYGKYIKYDLKDLASDFYNLGDNAIVYEGNGTKKYLSTTDYYRESDHILVLPANMPGMYTIYYHAYPSQLTIETLDETVLDIDPDLAVLLPLYMAAELYKDDDNGIATTYRNEFEVGLEALTDTSRYSGKEQFTSEWV